MVNPDRWTERQLQILKDEYRKDFIRLSDLEKRIGRHKGNICRKARELGLTNQKRKSISKYRLSDMEIERLFRDFENDQPITLSKFARSRRMWPHGLSQLFKSKGYGNSLTEIHKQRRFMPELVRSRFEKQFVKGNGCWEWRGPRDHSGYGRFYGFGTSKAHRVSYQIYKSVPGKFLVCHHCDNPSCVNPDHLFLGTAKDNVQDCIKKGRWRLRNGKLQPKP
jgi:hypothetical protein